MRVETRRVEMADGSVKHLASVIDEVDPDRKDARRLLFLRTLADNPAILRAGELPFDSCTVRHDGVSWRADLEALEPRRKR